jgi:hypothetical protein
MIHDKRQFGMGLALMVVFLVGLVFIFRPMFENGTNLLDYLDGVFNSTSKASAYYIPGVREKADKLGSAPIAVELKAKGTAQAAQAEKLFRAAGATVSVEGAKLSVSGDLVRILAAALADADAMFKNEGASVSGKYGFDEQRVLYGWHGALGETVKELNRQEKFREAAVVRDVITKGIEPAYNYYGVTAISMKDMIWIALAALGGYVVYTVWYGYAILFLFEGWGLKLEH